MCVICVNYSSNKIGKKEFFKMWDQNPHGFGMAWINEDLETIVFKTNDKKEALNSYNQAKAMSISPIVLHFRISTGGNGINNLHPFEISNGAFLFHNGHVDGWGSALENLSDTNQLSQFLKATRLDFTDPKNLEYLNNMIGYDYNKVVILHPDGTINILNENLGSYDGGNWYSNLYHRKTYGGRSKSYSKFYSSEYHPCNFCTKSDCFNCDTYRDIDMLRKWGDQLDD